MAKPKRKGLYARDVDRLNMWFAVIAIASLLSVLWMVWDDYARPWKSYQREFRVLETEATQQQLANEQAAIDQQELSTLRQQRDTAEQTLSGQVAQLAELESELARVSSRLELADQNLRFARSTYDARRWEFEEARKHEGEEHAASERATLDAAIAAVSEYGAEVEQLTAERDTVRDELIGLTGARDDAASEIIAMTREIERLDARVDDLRFNWVYYLRNAPFMDSFNPSVRINQVVLNNVRFDLNFTDAPRVDRCQSCHLGAASTDYATAEQPFTTHPRLDMFVADNAVHPAAQFGCSSCHGGKGHATSFLNAVHTPDNESERERWEHEYGWEPTHLWEWPMRPTGETEASCLSCHGNDNWLPDAPRVEYGVELVEKLGCYGCHQIDRFDDRRKPAPNLSHIGSKTDFEWAYNWVMDPKSYRPNTRMPRFFNLSNSSDGYWTERNKVEAESIVTYLFDNTSDIELESAPAGNADRGNTLFDTIGCLGCHTIGDEDEDAEGDRPGESARFSGYRHHGPNLGGLGSKVNPDWLYTWVRDPTHYWDETVMPDLRLTSQEAGDITAYLIGIQRPGWEDPQVPTVDAALRDEVALEYLRAQLPSNEAAARLESMGEDETRAYLGERLITRYGCSGCHLIPGFENAGRIGTSLSEWGSKPVTRLDFGLRDQEHERRGFLEQKLRAPRSYDDGRVRSSEEMLRMPSFDLTEEEIEAIATAIMGFTSEETPIEGLPAPTPQRLAIEKGRHIADVYNCRGCHILEDRGGAIRDVIADAMVASGSVASHAAGLVFGPPNLKSEGSRVQPTWLYRFFDEPSIIRPWLEVRMPTFQFDDDDLNSLTAYFAALDEAPYPFEETFTTAHEYPANLVREGAVLAADQRGSLQCFSCHFRGNQEPRVPPTQWAPDLALAADRLRPEWIDGWIKDPQSLQPGTNMPQFYANLEPGRGYWAPLDNDPQVEIDALVAYIMSLGN